MPGIPVSPYGLRFKRLSAGTAALLLPEGFEGRTVTKVDLSANPGMDIESFRALLTVKAGQPFSMKAMRESVDALQKTNLFSQVQVSVEPEQAGLRVLFILQPAPYVGLIEFPAP